MYVDLTIAAADMQFLIFPERDAASVNFLCVLTFRILILAQHIRKDLNTGLICFRDQISREYSVGRFIEEFFPDVASDLKAHEPVLRILDFVTALPPLIAIAYIRLVFRDAKILRDIFALFQGNRLLDVDILEDRERQAEAL